jgi:hypothetical protein
MKRGVLAVTVLCGAALTACNSSVVPPPSVVSPTTTPVTLRISPPATTAQAGLVLAFPYTLGIPQGAAIRTMTVNWGDGNTTVIPFTTPSGGSDTFTGTLSHVYSTAGNYTVSATVVDTAGNTITVSTSFMVG